MAVFIVVWARDDLVDALPSAAIFTIALAVLLSAPHAKAPHAKVRRASTPFVAIEASAWLLPLAGSAITIIAVGEEAGSPEFHSASAQVLPVLALGLAIEARTFEQQLSGGRNARATALVTLALLAYGEYEALDSLVGPVGTDAELVWAALAAGAIGVLLVAALGNRATPTRARKSEH